MNIKPNFLLAMRLSLSSGLLFPFLATADVVYVGYSQNQLSSVVGSRNIDFDPGGLNLNASFNLNDNWSIGVDLGQQDDTGEIGNNVTAAYDSDNWGMNVTYFHQNWAFAYRFSDWRDELEVMARLNGNATEMSVQTQNNDSPSHSLSVTHYITGENWQIGLSGSLHYNDWEQEIVSMLGGDSNAIIATNESGESTFLSAGIDGAWFLPITEGRNLILGGSVNWNEYLSNEADDVTFSGRNVNQFRNRNLINNLNNLSVSGSESYGQASVYASLDITEAWLLDISTGVDFGLDETGQYWSLSLGYLF